MSSSAVLCTQSLHTNAHSLRGRSTLKDVERFRNRPVREHNYERRFTSGSYRKTYCETYRETYRELIENYASNQLSLFLYYKKLAQLLLWIH